MRDGGTAAGRAATEQSTKAIFSGQRRHLCLFLSISTEDRGTGSQHDCLRHLTRGPKPARVASWDPSLRTNGLRITAKERLTQEQAG